LGLDKLTGKCLQRPAHLSAGWRGACQSDQKGFLLSIQQAWCARTRFFLEREIQSAQDKTLADSFNRRDAGSKGLGNFFIREFGVSQV
jgi:hypothetical protein